MKTKSASKTKINAIDIANIAEDLLNSHPNPQPVNTTQNLSKPIELMNRLLQKEVAACAKNIGVDAEELQAWIDCQIEVPHKTLLCLLRTANEYRLDPLRDEVLLTQYENHWQASISVDGWIRLLHRHPAFSGITFTESPEPQNPQTPSNTWMECSIYRSDQVMPTTVREYLSEVQHEGEIWKKMPKRMLRHRALQQCARLAMGIKPPDLITDDGKKMEIEADKNLAPNFHLHEKSKSDLPHAGVFMLKNILLKQ
jgi:hypothetical protein